MSTKMVPTEAQEQSALFQWAGRMQGRYPALGLMYHIPNGGSRNPIEARHLKTQGVKAGVPDICIPVSNGRYAALYIEMKRTKGGRVSEEQKAWITALNRAGNLAIICRGWEEARRAIMDYLSENRGRKNDGYCDGT